MKLVNLTPHDVVVFDGTRAAVHVPVAGSEARIVESRTALDPIAYSGEYLSVFAVHYADRAVGLPDPIEGTTFLVSRITAQAMDHRADLLFPLDEVRDNNGRIIGCRSLGRFRRN